ncbi:MAG: transglutaminase family protein [Bdellovibrionales bacterium]
METLQNALKILRNAGNLKDDSFDIAQVALALACLDKGGADMTAYQAHLDHLVSQIEPHRSCDRVEDQLKILRDILVIQQTYKSVELPANNLMDVIDRRQGDGLLLGVLYLHLAQKAGWAMMAVDVSGHFLLRLSARDGQLVIDPSRAGQPCLIHEVKEDFLEDDDLFQDLGLPHDVAETIALIQALGQPMTHREVLLRLQHNVKRQQLSKDHVEGAISTLQSMLLFAPQQENLWCEIGHLQAERGHLRAAITALEVVCDMAPENLPASQTTGALRELRMRLN